MANRLLYRHAPNWFPTLLALQDTRQLHTTWRYTDLIAVVYLMIFDVNLSFKDYLVSSS